MENWNNDCSGKSISGDCTLSEKSEEIVWSHIEMKKKFKNGFENQCKIIVWGSILIFNLYNIGRRKPLLGGKFGLTV